SCDCSRSQPDPPPSLREMHHVPDPAFYPVVWSRLPQRNGSSHLAFPIPPDETNPPGAPMWRAGPGLSCCGLGSDRSGLVIVVSAARTVAERVVHPPPRHTAAASHRRHAAHAATPPTPPRRPRRRVPH